MPQTEGSQQTQPSQASRWTQLDRDQFEAREQISVNEGITRLTRLAGVASIHGNLQREDAAAKRETLYNEMKVWAEGDPNMPPEFAKALEEDDGMQILAARDVYFNTPPPDKGASPDTANKTATTLPVAVPLPTLAPTLPTVQTPSIATPGASNGVASNGLLKRAAIIASMFAGATTPLALAGYFMSQRPVNNIQQLDPSNFELRLIPPDKPKEPSNEEPAS